MCRISSRAFSQLRSHLAVTPDATLQAGIEQRAVLALEQPDATKFVR